MSASVASVAKLKKHSKEILPEVLTMIFLLGIMVYVSFKNFLLFHGLVELFSIIIAFCISIIALNTYKVNKNHFVVFLGIAYAFIASLDLIHTLAYKGMGVFADTTGNLPTQLWIAARYMEGISLLISVLYLDKRIRYRPVIFTYLTVFLVLLLSIFYWKVFPDCFVEGIGLTSFKIISEYVIIGILALGLKILVGQKEKITPLVYWLMIFSFISTIISGLFFTFYIDVYGLSNIIGHVFKVISFYLVYKGIVELNFKAPYQELQINEERYRNLVELLPAGVYINEKERFAFANPAFLKMMDIQKKEDLIGKPIFDFFHQDYHDRIQERIEKIRQGNQVELVEQKYLTLTGNSVDVEVIAAPFPYGEEEAIIVIAQDITERKKTEKLQRNMLEQKRLLRSTQRQERLKTEFFSNLSHEMRTPLNLIFSTIQLLELECRRHKTEVTMGRYLRILRQNCYRMLRLVNNFLDITKMDAGYFQMNFKNHNIVSIVEDITLSIAEYMQNHHINLVFDTDVEEKMMAVDPNGIERVMLNLLSNATKFTNPGGEITVNIYDKVDSIVIVVKDTGTGIPKDKLTSIFDRYRQVDKTLKRNQQGTGIGLSLVSSIVEMHGGEIRVESEYGRGSEFIIELPVRVINVNEGEMGEETNGGNTYVEKITVEFSDIYSLENIS